MQDRARETVSTPATAVAGDVLASRLYSADLAPVPPERRTWGTYNFTALWIAMAHCLPTYALAGGFIAKGMSWWQALLTIGVGSLIVLVPILLNAHPGTKYGVPFPVLARASFGTRGANLVAVLRAIVACGWFGINAYFGGEAVKTFLVALAPGFGAGAWAHVVPHVGLDAASALCFLVFWALNIFIIYRGMNAVRVFENWAAPAVLVMAAALLGWLVKASHGLGPLLARPSQLPPGAFLVLFIPSVTAVVGFWSTLALNIPDFTRYGRGQKEQAVGQTLGLPTTMVLFSAMAVVITSAAENVLAGMNVKDVWDPTQVLAAITSSVVPPGHAAPFLSAGARAAVAVLALVGIGVATLSVNIAANVVSPANDFANLAPRRISFKTGGLITGLLGVAIMPWKLMHDAASYTFAWLVGYSALLGPIAGIMIADYWIHRRTQLDVDDLYREEGRYRGIRWQAMVALGAGILPNVPGFAAVLADPNHTPSGFFDWLYIFAWFLGFLVAGGVYLVLVRGRMPASEPSI